MNASANKLFGLCREFGFCLEDCGLCEQITKPSMGRPAQSPVFELPELEADELEQIAPPHRRAEKQCEVCGAVKRINHNCKGPKAYIVKLPKATPVDWEKVEICDWCRRKKGGHYAWCQDK